jgi:N-acetylmuramoyl-L-alanine amidase
MLITPKLLNRSMLKNVKLRLCSAQVLVILLLKICFVFGQKKVVVIDPGHGGIDSGAIGVNGTYEKDVVLKVSKAILKLDKSLFDNELDIYLTRYKDTLISVDTPNFETVSLIIKFTNYDKKKVYLKV